MQNHPSVLRGNALRQADPAQWKELGDQYEADSFESFQGIGYQWEPTRSLLVSHISWQIDFESKVRNTLRALKVLCAINLAGLAAIASIILKLLWLQ
jgi:hypothetical protein